MACTRPTAKLPRLTRRMSPEAAASEAARSFGPRAHREITQSRCRRSSARTGPSVTRRRSECLSSTTLIGQLGGNIPLPGGSGGLDLGLICTFAPLDQPLPVTTAAVLVYHAISLSIAAMLNSVAYHKLRRTLQREPQAAAMCMPLAEPIATVRLPPR